MELVMREWHSFITLVVLIDEVVAKVYNMVGSYAVLMDELQKNGITGFRTLDELLEYFKQIDFEKSCAYAKHKEQLLRDMVALPDEVQQSTERIEKVKSDTYSSLARTLDELKEKRQELSHGDLPFIIRLRV